MSIRVACPSCRKVYNLDDTVQGKTVLCRDCRSPIAVPALAQGRREAGGRPPDDRIATSSRPASAAGRAGHDEDGPQRRPAERRSRHEDEGSQGGKNLVLILLGVGGAALVLVGLVIGGLVLVFFLRPGASSKQAAVAQAAVADEQPPIPAEGRAGPAPGAAGPVAGPPAGPPQGAEPAIPAGPVPAEMAADVVQKVKQSTAYLRVRRTGGDVAEGSGFFALEPGIVITNAHVVGMMRGGGPPRGVDVVIHSGEAGEAKLAGTVLGVDRENDLAVLRVARGPSRLPAPLPVGTAAGLTETQSVYIFGFPFGAQLGKNITVSSSAVAALRRGGGVLKQVQVNGGMNPGNSGGPVTDARGVVVAVAGIAGTQINFAIPGDFIRPLVERSKRSPLDQAPPPGPLAGNQPPARNDLPAGPPPGAGLAADLAALRGTWQSGPVPADGGQATGTVKLSITPNPGGLGGRLQMHISTKQAGRTTSSNSSYSFTLRQNGGERALVTNVIRRARGTTRGIVLVYRFEGSELVVSGQVSSLRFGYTLKNVSLRRTSAEPEQAPAPANPANPAPPTPPAGGRGQGASAALKISGDVFAFVQEAVRDKRLTDVDIRGFTLSQKTYRDVCEEGGVLIGFEVGLGKFGNNATVKSLRPIFRTKTGEKFGKWQGTTPTAPVTLKAKPGYVVSGLSLRTGLGLDALSLVFTKLGPNGYVSGDMYNSEQAGGNGGGPSTAGGNGALFVGVTGHLGGDGSPCSLGLVAVLPKD
jgi:S1-C subfamily serine protease